MDTLEMLGIISDYIPQYKTSGAACFDLESAQTHTFQKNELFVLNKLSGE